MGYNNTRYNIYDFWNFTSKIENILEIMKLGN